jgi:AraC family transcriptional regulator of adaptative response / DNA-3-methyladenine glycosylase II
LIERRLSYTPPLAADALFRFLGDRTIPGVESCDGTTFRRAVRTPDAGATVIELAAQPDREAVRLRVLGDEGVDPSVVSTARRLLDLDADPSIVDTALSSDPSLRPLVRATPGLRLPGTADGFELVVRAILGQQISVRAARTFAGRIAEACGTPLERTVGHVTRLFPTAERLAASSLDGLGLTTAREATLRRVAELVASGELDLSGAADLEGTRERLLAVRGIGPWTVAYVSMRALGDRDAFPAEDLGVRLGFESLGLSSTPAAIRDHAERWRPWRAYAVMYLWNSLHG